MDPRGYCEPTDGDLVDRLAARLGSWSRLAVTGGAGRIPTQAEGRLLG